MNFLRTAAASIVAPVNINAPVNITIREQGNERKRSSKASDDISGRIHGAKSDFVSRFDNRH